MDKRRVLFVFTAIIVLSLFGLLGIYAVRFNKYIDYIELERSIVSEIKRDNSYKDILKDNKDNSLIISLTQLENIDLEIKNDTCIGYGVIKQYWFIYTYKGYIKCQKYQTKGFKQINIGDKISK